jgi:hypothetical protein
MAARPVYSRLLRLRHLKLQPATTLLLFEGSIGLGALLALADIVTWWGVLVVPAAVAVMVKLNDVVAGSLVRPLAVAQVPTSRSFERAVVGRSAVRRPSRQTAEIDGDDAVADPNARPDPPSPTVSGRAPGIARGVAVVPSQVRLGDRRPSPGAREPESPLGASVTTESAEFVDGSPSTDGSSSADGSSRTDSAARGRARGNQGRFTT